MTNATRRLLDSFEALPDQEKHEVLSQLLRRLVDSSYSSLSDEELTQAADLLFQEYDHLEARVEAASSRRGLAR